MTTDMHEEDDDMEEDTEESSDEDSEDMDEDDEESSEDLGYPDYDELDRRYLMEMKEEDDRHHVGDRKVAIHVRFHDYTHESGCSYYGTNTVGYLISSIKHHWVPRKKKYYDRSNEEYRIKDGAMFVFQGEDLCTKDRSLTLDELGMDGSVDVLIFYPGPVSKGGSESMSSDLDSLVEKIVSSAKDDCIVQLLKNLEVSYEEKVIFVQIPVFDGTNFVISIKENLNNNVQMMKSYIKPFLLNANDDPWQNLHLEAFDVFYNGHKLDTESSLARYEVVEHCHLKLSWNDRGAQVSVPLHITTPMLDTVFKVAPSDTVGKLKVRVHQLSGVPPEKQLLFHENMLLLQTCKSQRLVDCGISFFSLGLLPWAPRNRLLDVFPLTFWLRA